MTVTLTGDLCDAHVARGHARQVLRSLGSVDADEVLVVVSELVTNALLHGRCPIMLRLVLEPPEVIVSVTDCGARRPYVRHPDPDEEDGRGVAIVQRLSARWHVEQAVDAKTIVAVMRPPGD